MKVSFMCSVTYEEPEAHNYPGDWPTPPELFDPPVGQRTFDDFLECAAVADELGFDWVSVSEHHFTPLILTPSVAPLAGALSQVVKRARIALLGPLAPPNNPVRTAEEIGMLDHLTHGRLIVLPLRGTLDEFNAYGPIDPARTKGLTQEATRLIQKALSEPRPFSWDGEYFHYPTVAVWPQPVQRPFPPMFYSGNSPDSAIFAAQNRLGVCFSFHSPDIVAQTVAQYRAEAARVGWEPTSEHILYRGFVVCADTADEAERLAERFVPPKMSARIERNKRHQLGINGAADATGSGVPEDWARGAQQPRSDGALGFGLGRLAFAGTPDTLLERIRTFQEQTGIGVLDFVFSAGNTPREAVRRGVELVGREVVPALHEVSETSVTPV